MGLGLGVGAGMDDISVVEILPIVNKMGSSLKVIAETAKILAL